MTLAIRFSFSLGILLLSLSARAELPSDYFDALTTLQANFTQTVVDENGQILEQSSGEMSMLRPGRFRWEYHQPYSQLIVADGERIWLYDRDLEQITVRRLDATLSSAPLAMLGNDAPLASAFKISRLGERDGLNWFNLQPQASAQASQSEIVFIRLGFEGSELRTLEVEDNLRRLTRMTLAEVQRNPALDAALFTFTPPPGVDVIGDS